MSPTPVFAFRFRDGRAAAFSRALAAQIFNRGAVGPGFGVGLLQWADGEAEIDVAPGEAIEGFRCASFSGPTVFKRLYELAVAVGLTVIRDVVVVTDGALIAHLPVDFLGGEAVLVAHSLHEFLDLLDAADDPGPPALIN